MKLDTISSFPNKEACVVVPPLTEMAKGSQTEICPSQPMDSLLAVCTYRTLGDEADGEVLMNFEEVSQQMLESGS